MDRESLLDTIRRLLALGSSPNEHEAALALAKATELMAKHGLSTLDVGEAADSNPWVDEELVAAGAMPVETNLISPILYNFFYAKIVVVRVPGRSRLLLFGRRDHVVIARYVYLYLRDTFRRLARQRRIPRRHRRGYFAGLASGIDSSLRRSRGTLVPLLSELDRTCEQHFGGLLPVRRSKPLECSAHAYERGVEDGANIHIRPAIDAGPPAGAAAQLSLPAPR